MKKTNFLDDTTKLIIALISIAVLIYVLFTLNTTLQVIP